MTTSTNFLSEVPRERIDSQHRDRLVVGLLSSIEERGYAATTVADIVRHTKVSKRTFYEQFADKEDVLRALYQFAVANLKARIETAGAEPLPWRERIHATIHAFAEGLAEYPGLARTLLLELPASGPITMTLRDEVHDGFAMRFVQGVDEARLKNPELSPLSLDLAKAVIGAIYELLIRGLGEHDLDSDHVADVGTELLARVLTAPGTMPPTRG